jgi:acyl-CoA reductase-like NAD-dependent aldehyde dehydrogenase
MAAAAKTIKKVIMELGGKNPAIIMPDANLDHAVEILAHHQFHNCGPGLRFSRKILHPRKRL